MCEGSLCCQVPFLPWEGISWHTVKLELECLLDRREHLKGCFPWSPAKLQGFVICAADDELGWPCCSAALPSRFGGAGERGISNRSSNGPLLVLAGCWLSPVRDE